MTRGHRGSLLLQCRTLSFLSPCRFIPAILKFHSPSNQGDNRYAPANTPGIRHIAFAVEDIDAVVAGLRARGAELVGELERYEDGYRLCYVRGPAGIIVELADQIG